MSGTKGFSRRRFFAAAATTAAGPPAVLGSFRRVNAMTHGTQQGGTDKSAIRPFRFEASNDDLADLRRRITATKWPDPEQVSDASQGVQLATMRKLALGAAGALRPGDARNVQVAPSAGVM
jgi:Epoxide hydrolase N terminus